MSQLARGLFQVPGFRYTPAVYGSTLEKSKGDQAVGDEMENSPLFVFSMYLTHTRGEEARGTT